MSESSLDADQHLACGRTVGELVEHLAGDAPPEFAAHAVGCPHCQAALADLAPGWEPVRRAAQLSVEPPRGLLERTLLTVRGARDGAGGSPAEIAQEQGSLRVAPQATLVLARRLSGELLADRPGVRLLACTGDVHEVRVDLQVGYGLDAPEVTTRLRAELERALRNLLGAAAPAVWVRVADVAPRQGS